MFQNFFWGLPKNSLKQKNTHTFQIGTSLFWRFKGPPWLTVCFGTGHMIRHFLMASVHWTPKRCAKREAAKACIVFFFFGRSEVCEYVMNNCISLLFDAESTYIYIYTLEDIKAHMPSTMSACGGCIGKSANSPPSGTRATCEQRSMQLSLLQSQPCQVCTQTMRFYFSIPYPCTWFSGFSVIQLRSVNSILQAQQKDLRC